MASRAPFDIGQFIEVDPDYADGWPVVAGTRIPIVRLGQSYVAGNTPAEISLDWDLPIEAVLAGLAYYQANRQSLDDAVEAYDAESKRIAESERGASAPL